MGLLTGLVGLVFYYALLQLLNADGFSWRGVWQCMRSTAHAWNQCIGAYIARKKTAGFTLIELSIVLVVIGLVVGGILVGQSLIAQAGVRATITQVEKYQTATNTFREKTGYLPGDIPTVPATQFGLIPRVPQLFGTGDGNGIIEGNYEDRTGGNNSGNIEMPGETTVFWVDLSTMRLIDGGFNTASNGSYPSIAITSATTPSLSSYFPAAKIGQGNYVYVWSGGIASTWNGLAGNGTNYFGISAVTAVGDGGSQVGVMYANPGLTVAQAYAIDAKIDDGLPQSGNVTAVMLNSSPVWAGTNTSSPPYTTATAGSSSSCFDNSSAASGTPGVGGTAQHYSLEIGNGSNVTCALSFRFQ